MRSEKGALLFGYLWPFWMSQSSESLHTQSTRHSGPHFKISASRIKVLVFYSRKRGQKGHRSATFDTCEGRTGLKLHMVDGLRPRTNAWNFQPYNPKDVDVIRQKASKSRLWRPRNEPGRSAVTLLDVRQVWNSTETLSLVLWTKSNQNLSFPHQSLSDLFKETGSKRLNLTLISDLWPLNS